MGWVRVALTVRGATRSSTTRVARTATGRDDQADRGEEQVYADLRPAVGVEQQAAQGLALEQGVGLVGEGGVLGVGLGGGADLGVGLSVGDLGQVGCR